MALNIYQYKKKEESQIAWYQDEVFKITLHVAVWVIIVLFPYIFNYEESQKNPFRDLNTATNIFRIGLFYLNAELLVPMLIYRKKWVAYLLSLVLLFCLMMAFHGALY